MYKAKILKLGIDDCDDFWGCSLKMGRRRICVGKKGEDQLRKENCSNLVLNWKKNSTNNKTLQRTFGNLKEEMWRSSKFSVCKNAFILFMFVISALEFPSGWCCLAWSDFNPLQKAFLNFPVLISHFFFTCIETFVFQREKKVFFSSYHLITSCVTFAVGACIFYIIHKSMEDTCTWQLSPYFLEQDANPGVKFQARASV